MFTNEYVAVKLEGNACGGGGGGVDCEQSLFFFRFSGGSASSLTDQEKKETMRSLWDGGERKIIF